MAKSHRNLSVTTITSLYKSERYLETFLENCLDQSFFRNTVFSLNFSQPSKLELDILAKYKCFFDGNLDVKIHESVVSVYQAWNEICSKLNTPYAAIWNVDDLRTEFSLENQFEMMSEGHYSSVAGCFCVVGSFGSESGQIVDQSESPVSHWFNGMLHGPFFMFKRTDLSILKGFDEKFTVAGDFDFAIRLASLGKVGYVKENLGFYLNERSGLSTSLKSILPVERERIYLRYGVMKKFDFLQLPVVANFDFTTILVSGERYLVSDSMRNFEEIRSNNINQGFTYRLSTLVFVKLIAEFKFIFRSFIKKHSLE